MKVAIILCVLVAGSQANFFDDLGKSLSGVGHAFTDTFHQVGEQAKVVGGQLLQTAKEQGTQLASQALQSLLLGTMNAFQGQQQPSSKRDLSNLVNQFSQFESMTKDFLKDKVGQLQSTLTDTVNHLQQVAASHSTDLPQQVSNLVQGHTALSNQFKQDLLSGLSNMFKEAFKTDTAKRSELTNKIHEILSQLDVNMKAVFDHYVSQGQTLISQLEQQLLAHYNSN